MPPRAQFRASLRLRLTLWLVAIALSIHVALALVVLFYQRVGVERFLDSSILERTSTIAAAMQSEQLAIDDDEAARLASNALRLVAFDRIFVALYGPDGSLVASNARGDAPPFARVREQLGNSRRVVVRSECYPPLADEPCMTIPSRGVVIPLLQPGHGTCTLLVAATDDFADQLSSLVGWVLGVTVPIGVLAAAIAGWVVAGIATRPLREIGEFASSLLPEHLDRPVHLHAGTREVADLERKLDDARGRLQAALQSQDRFISNVSHELKTPVAVLLAEAQTLPRERWDTPQRRFVESVIDEMRRLGRMVDSFLALTRLRAGKGAVRVGACNLNDVVLESMASCATMARSQGIALQPELLDSDHDPTVRGEPELLRVLLDNLVRNAIRFSPPGGRVRVLVSEEEDHTIVAVEDEGPGVPESLMPRLFDRFTQGTAERTRGRGHGLGLSIAQGLAELHGGLIRARNLPVCGCRFELALPRANHESPVSLT